MNADDKKLYRELVDERENLFAWFESPLPARSFEMMVLVNRVLARQREREQQRKGRCRSVPENRHPSSRGVARETQTGESNYGASSIGFASGK